MPRGQSCLLEAIKSITYSQYAINREHKPIVTAVFSLGGGGRTHLLPAFQVVV